MKAIIAKTPGDADVLEILEVDEPAVQADEIKIRVKAFGLNKAEGYNRQGKHGGFSGKWALGIEATGEVMEDPRGEFAAGQKVLTAMGGMMFSRHGSYAEYITVKRSNVQAVNTELDWVTLASLPEAYLTVWGALDKQLNIAEGETLLVRGGTTGIGTAAITYAKARGLTVIATTRHEANRPRLLELGAHHVVIDDGEIHENVKALVPGGADKALELVGAVTVLDTMKSLKRFGEVAFVGFVGGPPVLDKLHLMNDLPNTVRLGFFGSGALGSEDLPVNESPLPWIIEQIEQKNMPRIVSKTFSFEQIREAHRFMESNQALGKIVVTL